MYVCERQLTTNSKVLSLSATGYRHDAVKLALQEALAPRGLTGLAIDTLDASTVEIKEVFSVLAGYYPDEDENEWYYDGHSPSPSHAGAGAGAGARAEEEEEEVYPVLIHCTQGKDRTGLVVLLVLLLVLDDSDIPNVPNAPDNHSDTTSTATATAAITADYKRSEQELVPEKEDRLQELRYMGIPESFLLCPGEFTAVVRGHLSERYGGVSGYLEYIGVSAQMRDSIRRFLV